MIIVCREEARGAPEGAAQGQLQSSVRKPRSDSPETSALEKQQKVDDLRRCWSPNEGDLENARRVLQLQFMERATARQFGEPLLSRSDMTRMLGKLPQGHGVAPPSLLEV